MVLKWVAETASPRHASGATNNSLATIIAQVQLLACFIPCFSRLLRRTRVTYGGSKSPGTTTPCLSEVYIICTKREGSIGIFFIVYYINLFIIALGAQKSLNSDSWYLQLLEKIQLHTCYLYQHLHNYSVNLVSMWVKMIIDGNNTRTKKIFEDIMYNY